MEFMKKAFHEKILFLLVIIILLDFGCSIGPPRKVLNNYYSMKNFGYKDLTENGIAIFGAIDQYNTISNDELEQLDNLLLEIIRYYRNEYKTFSSFDVKNAFGIDNYKRLKIDLRGDKYRLKKELRSINIPMRYLLVYDIKKDMVSQSDCQTDDEYCYVTVRKMSVQLDIYDTYREEYTWGGSIDRIIDEKHCNPKSKVSEEMIKEGHGVTEKSIGCCIGIFFDVAIETTTSVILGTYPEPPSTENMMGRIFIDFVRNMPLENKKEPHYKIFP